MPSGPDIPPEPSEAKGEAGKGLRDDLLVAFIQSAEYAGDYAGFKIYIHPSVPPGKAIFINLAGLDIVDKNGDPCDYL